jgi:hypothetical protein
VANKKFIVKLSSGERKRLEAMVAKGKARVPIPMRPRKPARHVKLKSVFPAF